MPKAITGWAFLLGFLLLLVGCGWEWSIHKAPEGFGVVREHIVFAPRNIPPVRSELDFTIFEIDGAPVAREVPPPFVDIQPGALVPIGNHHFRARVAPHRLPPGYPGREVSFDASVESGKVYFLVDKNGMPVLVEEYVESK